MTNTSIALGFLGESLACDILKKQGYKLIKRNYRTPVGEIDIIVQKDNITVFVEVKTRNDTKKGFPEESVNQRKLNKIHKNIQFYLKDNKSVKNYRIDVISLILSNNEIKYFRHIKNVF